MVRHRLEAAIIGAGLGVVVTVVAWWAVFSASVIIGDAAGTLGEPRYPLLPRVMIFAIMAAATGVLLIRRSAAITAAVISLAFVAYSLLVTTGTVPEVLLGVTTSWGISAAPGQGVESHGIAGAASDALHSIVSGATFLPLLFLTGVWTALAASALIASRAERPPLAPTSRQPPGWLGLVAGPVLGILGLWLAPVLGRAIAQMMIDGRAAFSVLPPLAALAAAAVTCLPILRWPRMAHGVAVAAVVIIGISVVMGDPPRGGMLSSAQDWWSISVEDLARAIAGAAFAPAVLVLASAWIAIAAAHLLRERRPHPAPRRPLAQAAP